MTHETLDLAIIGGGPAGLSAAVEAASLGIRRLALFERETEAGGAVRHCGHWGFGMLDLGRVTTGPTYAAALRAAAHSIDVRLSHAVTAIDPEGRLSVSTPAGPLSVAARRVLLATGIRELPRAGRMVSGGRPFGILTTGALQRFVYLHGRIPCRRPVIVGTELVSFSTLLTLRHAGVRPVALLGEARRPSAPPGVTTTARLLFGVPVRLGVSIVGIEGQRTVEGITIEDGRGRETVPCDAVVFTGRWVPEASLMRTHPAGVDGVTQGPVVDETLRTGDPALYAAGNVRFGVRSSGACALDGVRAARQIARDLLG